jgi:DNA-binding CsgD family transcriptional regulator
MMMPTLIKISIRIGLVTAVLIVLYELTNLLLIYHYLKYEYYIAGAVIVALVTGVMLANRYHQQQAIESVNDNPLESLTAKELRVLELISEGKSNKEIASLNYTEISTVKTHINNVFFKLGVKKRKDAVKVYQKSTLSPPVQI